MRNLQPGALPRQQTTGRCACGVRASSVDAWANGAFIHDLLDKLSAAEALTRSQREESLRLLTRYMDNRPPSPILPIEVKKAV